MTKAEKHPLADASSWKFSKPYIRVRSSVFLEDLATSERNKVSISTVGCCREGLISDIRTVLKGRTTNFIKKGENAWEGVLVPTHSITLEDARCRGKGDTALSVRDAFLLDTKKPRGVKVEEFLRVCDAVVGIPTLLLSPARQPGDWWRTDPKKSVKADGEFGVELYWNGADNVLLRHPALFASITGLFRQAYWLCKAGFGPNVLADLDYGKVEKVLTEPTWKEGLELAESLKTWICVPIPAGGTLQNVSFPWYPRAAKQVSYWQRFIRLQRALHRHSADEVFSGDIFESWALLNKGTQFSGAFTYWGQESVLTPAHKLVMKLGKPKEKTGEAE